MFSAHDRPDPAPHRYAPAGLGVPACGICQRPGSDPSHTKGLVDTIGADATQCPGCEEIWPIEMTVRMMRFVRPDGRELLGRNLRVCHECAGMPVNDWALLALRREKGWITEDQYVTRVQELAHRTETELRTCGHKNRWGTCMQVAGHEKETPHKFTVIAEQPR